MDIFTKIYLSIISEEEQQKTQWYCDICNQYFKTSRDLAAHKKVHPHKCKYCGQEFENGHKLGNHIPRCKLNPNYQKNIETNKNSIKNRVFHHSERTKKKISQHRKQYLKQHPESFVWRRADKFKSKPCEDLKQFLKDNNINFYPQYSNPQQFNRNFAIDIAFPNQKIAIEVNGTQHYQRSGNLTDYHKERHDILQKLGWKVYQIPYTKVYNKEVRQNLLKLIKDNIDFTYDYSEQIKQFNQKKLQQHICPICGGQKKDKYAKSCDKCNRERLTQQKRKNIPSKQQLIQDLEELKTYSAIGRKYNKTCNAVKRWFNNYNLI